MKETLRNYNMVEINGIKYLRKEQKPNRVSPKMANILTIAMALGGGMFEEKEKERPKVDIVKEYGLIQLKKSNLTKSQRDWVVWRFETNFEKVKQ